ncbi:MAG: hypothetical protein IH923_12100 [Nitrospinae bacterium]|nr:hypothetical protein [Nitrospinota bacterium]
MAPEINNDPVKNRQISLEWNMNKSVFRQFGFLRNLLLIFILTAFCSPFLSSPVWAAENSKERFLKDIRTSLDQKNLPAFIQLFNWDGVNEKSRAILNKHLFSTLFDEELESVRFKPLPEGFRSEYVLNGIRTYTNVKVLGFVEIQYKRGKTGQSKTSIPYGKKGGRYYFAGSIQEKIRENAPKSKQIQVIIVGMGHPPVTFEGYMLYLQNERPIKDQLKDMGGGNLTRMVRGDDITYLKVQRTTKKGTLRVTIIVDGKTIFETQPQDTDQPIIFKR